MPSYPRKYQLHGNLFYHIYNRSNRGFTIFHQDCDFKRFLFLLRKYALSFDFLIYNWVIMSNHFHILIELPIPELLPSIMSGIQRSYTHYHHRTYDTYGYLWQGRFKEQAVQKDRYLLACGRYIERNPVAAGIVLTAEEYQYSSAKYYTHGINDNLTAKNPLYDDFGLTLNERQLNYRSFLKDFDEDEHKNFDDLEHPIGNKLFISKLISLRGRHYPRRKGRPKKVAFKS